MKDKQWGIFIIGEVFDIKKVKGHTLDSYQYGKYPYVTTSALNNGVTNYVDAPISDISIGNTLTVNPISGEAFYQENDFVGRGYSGASINCLYNDNLNKYNALFLAKCITHSAENKASYANLFNSTRLERGKFHAPMKNDEPDWEYMEKIGKDLYYTNNMYIKDYLIKKIKLLDVKLDKKNGVEYYSKDWEAFNLLDFFEPKRGNQNNMASLLEGDTPLVSARKFENGYKDFVTSLEKPLYEGNIITLNNDGDGGAGIAYYQPHQMALDTHVTALYPKITLSKYHLLFITRTITHQRAKFGNNYPINNLRLKALKIMLPIEKNGDPNWDFMEIYMKQIEYQQLSKLIKYLN